MSTWIRHTHPWGFRTGTWAEISGIELTSRRGLETPCYRVRFPDGVSDLWAIYDVDEPYEFSDGTPADAEEKNR